MRFRAHHLCEAATARLAAASPNGCVAFEGPAWNGNTVPLIAAAKAHCLLAVHDSFVAAVRDMSGAGGGVQAALGTLARLHGLVLLEQGASDLLESGYINGAGGLASVMTCVSWDVTTAFDASRMWMMFLTGTQLQTIKGALYETLTQVRPDAVAYVDAFGLTDYLLNSALGREVRLNF